MAKRDKKAAQLANTRNLITTAENSNSNPRETQMLISTAESLISSAEAQITSAEVIISSSEAQIESLNNTVNMAEKELLRFAKIGKPKDKISKGRL